MRTPAIVGVLTGAALLSASTTAIEAQPRPAATRPPQCFSAHDWAGWRATNDGSMLIRVRGRDVYRVEFAGGCPNLSWPDVHLVTVFRGSEEVCAPIDLDLKVSDGHGMASACIVSKITPLSYAEVDALPRKALP
jgi:hypothetical protein